MFIVHQASLVTFLILYLGLEEEPFAFLPGACLALPAFVGVVCDRSRFAFRSSFYKYYVHTKGFVVVARIDVANLRLEIKQEPLLYNSSYI